MPGETEYISGSNKVSRVGNVTFILLTCTIKGRIFVVDEMYRLLEEQQTFRNFFETLEEVGAKYRPSRVYWCTGPGSFTGIRQTASYILGLKTGMHNLQTYAFSLFDYIGVVKKLSQDVPVFINGFFHKADVSSNMGYIRIPGQEIRFINLDKEEIPSNVKSNLIKIEDPTIYYTFENAKSFVQTFTDFSASLAPLYAKRVDISMPK